jgi:aspartyl-tRNA(Asn)/glutamyl-tRNA(Gln) amidotransferase subunit A
MTSFASMAIHELAPLIQRRAVSPVEVTQEILDRVQQLDPQLHAFITLRPEAALADARQAEAEIAEAHYRGPLHGIPMGIKDNISVAGWPTTNGSALMTDRITDYDAAVVERLRAGGVVVVGKTNMHEWAMGAGTSTNAPFGAMRNPWDETCICGGSSGGSAAAVSTSMIYGSVGTDGMGSIRMPASYCGVVGLKPTYGLVSRFGELPPTSSSTDHLGPIAKDVRDAAILLDVLAGYDPRDPTSIDADRRDYAAELDRGVVGLRIGVPQNYFFDEATPEVRDAVLGAVQLLGSLGASVQDVTLPSLQYIPLVGAATVNESRAFLLPFALEGPEAFADQSIWERVVVGEFVRTADTLKAARLRNVMRAEFLAVMETIDILAMPTTPTPAFPLESASRLEGRDWITGTTSLTYPFNLMGMPAVSIPCGFSSDGLPIGLMLAGRHWEDSLVLRAAFAYEQAATHGYVAAPLARG